VWCADTTSDGAPIDKDGLAGPAAEFVFAIALPAMVHLFFEFNGGQRAAIRSKPKTANDIANLIGVS
jgi:hypothetical protein